MDKATELLTLAQLIIRADDVSLVTLTVGDKRAGIDPRLLRELASLLLAYQRASVDLRDTVTALDAEIAMRGTTCGEREVLLAARKLIGQAA